MKRILLILSMVLICTMGYSQMYTTAYKVIKNKKPRTVKTTITKKKEIKTISIKEVNKDDIEEFTSIRSVEMIRLPQGDENATILLDLIQSGRKLTSDAFEKRIDDYFNTISKEIKSSKSLDDLEVVMNQISLLYAYYNGEDSRINSAVNSVKKAYKKIQKGN